MASLFRISRTKFVTHKNEAFNGEGAFRGGSRWNTPGHRMSFASTSLSLAQLEYLAHIDWNATVDDNLTLIEGSLDDRLIDVFPRADLPVDWARTPPAASTQALGDVWLRSSRSVGLVVPSAIVASESNVLLNSLHPDFKHVAVISLTSFSFDRRLWRA